MTDGAEELPASPFEDVDAGEPGDATVTGDGPLSRLFDGAARGPSVQELQAEYGLSLHWAIFTRGGVRAAVGGGVPPIVELVAGGIMGAAKEFAGGGDDGVAEGGDVNLDGEP